MGASSRGGTSGDNGSKRLTGSTVACSMSKGSRLPSLTLRAGQCHHFSSTISKDLPSGHLTEIVYIRSHPALATHRTPQGAKRKKWQSGTLTNNVAVRGSQQKK